MVEVFKTNVQDAAAANHIVEQLLERFPAYTINFDLEDCDKIPRIDGENVDPELISADVKQADIECWLL